MVAKHNMGEAASPWQIIQQAKTVELTECNGEYQIITQLTAY